MHHLILMSTLSTRTYQRCLDWDSYVICTQTSDVSSDSLIQPTHIAHRCLIWSSCLYSSARSEIPSLIHTDQRCLIWSSGPIYTDRPQLLVWSSLLTYGHRPESPCMILSANQQRQAKNASSYPYVKITHTDQRHLVWCSCLIFKHRPEFPRLIIRCNLHQRPEMPCLSITSNLQTQTRGSWSHSFG